MVREVQPEVAAVTRLLPVLLLAVAVAGLVWAAAALPLNGW
jgi:hypothetical protein